MKEKWYMKNNFQIDIEKLTVDEKLNLIEHIWENINKQNIDTVPEHHKKILEERIENLEAGKTNFKFWEEVRTKYL